MAALKVKPEVAAPYSLSLLKVPPEAVAHQEPAEEAAWVLPWQLQEAAAEEVLSFFVHTRPAL
jgi:hypothetical protein